MPSLIRINNAHALGFEEFEQTLEHIAKLQTESSYPPFNIERDLITSNGDTQLNITLAVAGFTADLLEVVVEGRHLVISGRKAEKEAAEFLHQGIATRQFKKNFILAETIEVISATLKDGLLIIKLLQPEPEQVLRKIPITSV